MGPEEDDRYEHCYQCEDEPDEWRSSCDDEMLSYEDDTDPDGSGERTDREYR